VLPRHRHEIARANLQRHRQIGEIDGRGEKISAVPRFVSALHHERRWFARGATSPLANDLEKTAVTLGSPEWFWALLAIPVLAILFARAEQRAVARLREFVAPKLLPQLSATVNRSRRVLRFGFLMLGLALAVVSLARPQVGYIYQDVKRKGLDLLFVVDTSRSML